MPLLKSRIRCLAPLALLLAVSGCATPERLKPTFPDRADLLPPSKPVPSADVVTSEQAANKHDIAIEAWGDALYKQVVRLCRYNQRMGLDIACPKE